MALAKKQEVSFRIVLVKPTAGVDFGLQQGSGTNYETIQCQRSGGTDLVFEFNLVIKDNGSGNPDFGGAYSQGKPGERFVYIDIGTCAGQVGTPWTRRLKVPLAGITPATVQQVLRDPELLLQCIVPGTGRDGGPNCATVKPFEGWQVQHRLPQNK
jgi:hypothetical protein